MPDKEEKPASNKAVWDIEKTHPELVLPFKEKMREVIDPELGMDVIALGLIRNVMIDGDHADVEVIMTTPFCPYVHVMIDMVRTKAADALERTVSIDLGMDPWDFSMMEDGAMPEWGIF
jgi:metal-sulfur cluster biosynthetic enzyme